MFSVGYIIYLSIFLNKTNMKAKLIFLLMLCSFYSIIVTAQVPQGFNYQAIARDGTGAILANTSLVVKITIQTTIGGGSIMWQETHSVTTNQFGALTIIIGTGTRIGGLSAFSAINWGAQNLFFKTEIDKGGGFILLGTTQLWSVPYSITADELTGSLDKLTVAGKATSMTEPLFEVKNNQGQTVFAVYNEGVRIYVSDGDAKGAKGGFAIGGFDMAKGIGAGEYLRVSRDSIRIYLNDSPVKSSKGGFAIGGFDASKGVKQDYLLVGQDSIRMYIKDAAKSSKGGFAIGGFSTAKANAPVPQFLSVSTNKTDVLVKDPTKGFTVSSVSAGVTKKFMDMNPLNNSFGEESGKSLAPAGDNGKFNSFMGFQSGMNTTSGSKNVIIGYQAGLNSNASYNILIGNESGKRNTGDYNIFLGHSSGILNQGGNGNVFMGFNSGSANTVGYSNMFLGVNTGTTNTNGNNNVFVGNSAGGYNNSGSNNVCVGSGSGGNFDGSGNVMIGYQAGGSETGSNKLYIDNSATSSPLIWGDFSANMVVINGKASNNPNNRTFFSNGAAGGTTAWWNDSDVKFKKDISTISDALNKVLKMNGVNYYWKDSTNRDPGKQMGFVAQDVLKVVPEVVSTTGESLSMQYAPLTALLVEAIKEQEKIINNQKTSMEELRSENKELQTTQAEIIKQLEIIKKQLAEKK